MYLEKAKRFFESQDMLHAEKQFIDYPSVIAYEKEFRWAWMATQLNTFIVVSDYGAKEVGVADIEYHLKNAFEYTKKHYKGWPRGLQSGIGVISIITSSNITEAAKAYCLGLKSGKKWAGFTVPVVVDTTTNEIFKFRSNPMWGRIYYPHFTKLIQNTVG